MRMKTLNKSTTMKKLLQRIGLTSLLLAFLFNVNAQEDDLYEMDLESLMQIEIVSASKKAEDIFDAPLGASVLTGEQIKESGATSIMEALRLVPGVIVREMTPGNYDIHLRGYDGIDPKGLINLTANTMTLIMVNNRTVYSEFQGQTYWELMQINIDDVQQIEVVRGPVSAMYGPNAVTGVINILTKSPVDKPGFHASTYTMGGLSIKHYYKHLCHI
jgi:iron complex outermembrane receptor protein